MKFLIVLVLILSSLLVHAQNAISGLVINEKQEALYGATVVLLQEIDSTMLDFSLTSDLGKYIIDDVDPGRYLLQVSYIGHVSYSEYIDIKGEAANEKLADIVLLESNELLQEIEVSAEHIPMGIKGDTISYNASAFKTRPNATVEDLLKMLPGIEVDRNSNIKAQGKDVKQLLVDGKEFFGTDPKIATKNLHAEAIDKVEVFDKKSEIAEFTGIDDGQENKTINLKLKEEFKKGGFGNAEAAKGDKGTYVGRLNYFRFNPKIQASFIAASNNINKETFSVNDRIDFLGGIGNLISSGDFGALKIGRLEDGLNTSTSIGTNFNIDLSPKLKFNSHYIYNSIDNALYEKRNSENLNGDNQFITIDTSAVNKILNSHAVNTKLAYKASPLLELVFKNNFELKNDAKQVNTLSQYFESGFKFGEASSVNVFSSDNFSFDTHTSIRKKFKKKGRSIISTVLYKRNDSTSDDQIDNNDNLTGSNVAVNQVQDYKSVLNQLRLSSHYTEPISKKIYLELEYTYASSIENPARQYFNVVNGVSILDEQLSSDYRKEYLYHIAGLSLRRNSKRVKSKVSLKRQWINLDGIINSGQSEIEGSFSHWLPSISFDLNMKGNKDIVLSYGTSVSEPRLEQLLPLPVNTSPSFNYIGNPNLIPEYTHSVDIRFNLFDNFNLTSLYSNLSFSVSRNRIVNKTDVSTQLVRFITPVNTDNYKSVSAYFNFSRPLRLLKINYAIKSKFNYSNYNSFLNGISSPVSDSNVDIKFSVQNRKTEFFYVDAGVQWNRSDVSYDINRDFDQAYFDLDFFLDADFYLPSGFTLSSELRYNRYSSDGFSENPIFYLWTASISKLLLKDKLELLLSAHDILDQNTGYRRFGAATSVSEQRFENLGQYFLLGLKYKIGKGKKENGVHIQISE